MSILDTASSPDCQVRFIFADRVVAVGVDDDVTLGGIAAAWQSLTIDADHLPFGIAVTFPMHDRQATCP
jgi:hypothetical protein